AMRHDGKFRTESLDMLGLALEEVHRDEQREVGLLRAGGLDPAVDLRLHPLPDRIAVRPDDHGSARWTVLGQFRLGQGILVPPWEVLVLRSQHRHLLSSPASLLGAAAPKSTARGCRRYHSSWSPETDRTNH